MIVMDDRKIIIITPPHTASGNLHKALCSPDFRGFWYVGPSPDDGSPDQHYAYIPNGKHHYHIALVVRHPLDRLVGLYWHYVYTCEFLEKLKKWWDFHQFVMHVNNRNHDLFYIYRWSINRLVREAESEPEIDSLIRFETLQEDVNELIGEEVDLGVPYDNTQWRKPWVDMYQKGSLQMAVETFKEDFEAYNYAVPISRYSSKMFV
jgi:hypothetical protein